MQAWQQKIEPHHDLPCSFFQTDISEFPPHWHKEIEIIYVLGEELHIGLNNEIFTLKTRDIFISSAGEIHYFPNQSKKCRRIIIQFDPSTLDHSSFFRDKRIVSPHVPFAEKSNSHALLEKDILEIGDEMTRRQEGFILAVKARLYDLLLHIIRLLPQEEISLEQRSRQQESLERLDKVFLYVGSHFQKEIYLDEIAQEASYSVFHFTRFFKKMTGMTFFEYLNKFRISKVSELLVQTNLSVTEVAFRSGFNSIKTFNRLFKKNQGCSPIQFRKRNI